MIPDSTCMCMRAEAGKVVHEHWLCSGRQVDMARDWDRAHLRVSGFLYGGRLGLPHCIAQHCMHAAIGDDSTVIGSLCRAIALFGLTDVSHLYRGLLPGVGTPFLLLLAMLVQSATRASLRLGHCGFAGQGTVFAGAGPAHQTGGAGQGGDALQTERRLPRVPRAQGMPHALSCRLQPISATRRCHRACTGACWTMVQGHTRCSLHSR